MTRSLHELAKLFKNAIDSLETWHDPKIKELTEEELCAWLETVERKRNSATPAAQ